MCESENLNNERADKEQYSPDLFYAIRKLIEQEGAVKIRSIVDSTNMPQHVLDLTHDYCQVCSMLKSTGTEG